MSAFASLPLSDPWIAAGIAVLVFMAAALGLGALGRQREELRAAMAVLGAMKASEFAHHVTSMLAQRGLRSDDLHRRAGHDGFDLRMTRGAARYLVQCKQGQSFHVTADTVGEFGSMVRLHGAEGGILVTTGPVDGAARRRASVSAIELIAGSDLWRHLEPLLPLGLTQQITATAAARRRKRLFAAAALGGLAGALVLAVGWMRTVPPAGGIAANGSAAAIDASAPPAAAPEQQAATAAPVAAPESDGSRGLQAVPAAAGRTASAPAVAAPTPATSAPADSAPRPSTPTPAPAVAGAPTDALPTQMPDPTLDAAQLAARRAQAERAVREVPGVARATWNTRSTMVLELQREGEDLFPEHAVDAACTELVSFEELRYTRLQVQSANPRNEDETHVRWRQCR